MLFDPFQQDDAMFQLDWTEVSLLVHDMLVEDEKKKRARKKNQKQVIALCVECNFVLDDAESKSPNKRHCFLDKAKRMFCELSAHEHTQTHKFTRKTNKIRKVTQIAASLSRSAMPSNIIFCLQFSFSRSRLQANVNARAQNFCPQNSSSAHLCLFASILVSVPLSFAWVTFCFWLFIFRFLFFRQLKSSIRGFVFVASRSVAIRFHFSCLVFALTRFVCSDESIKCSFEFCICFVRIELKRLDKRIDEGRAEKRTKKQR